MQLANDGARVQGQNKQLDVAPIMVGDTTMVPIRSLGDNFNIIVAFDKATQQITLSLKGKVVILKVGSKTATVNGKQVKLSSAPVVTDGRTLVPLRFVSENLDLFVNYTPNTTSINWKKAPKKCSDNVCIYIAYRNTE